ncbi:MAG: pilus (MSHA type) biogenesis protein MshL [Woeseiaceae bacterium]|nr:pilus (MSHA type) biogenesis protein MshL [Woeseiaceae bacterium]
MSRGRSPHLSYGLARNSSRLAAVLVCALLSACAGQPTVGFSSGHVIEEPAAPEPVVPEPVAPVAPEPEAPEEIDTYTVVVKDVPAADLLFSLARDAGLDLDLQAAPDKTVTINAVERPLTEILARVAEQAELRYELYGSNLVIQDDLPYWYSYGVDYVNVTRDSASEVGVATQIASTGGSVGEDQQQQQQQQGDGQGNLSRTVVRNNSTNDFWRALEMGLTSIVADPTELATITEENTPVIVNPMVSMVTVLGTQAEHQRVQRYLDRIMDNAARQVLIEMTIVEVELSDKYQAGVDWQRVAADAGDGWSFGSNLLGPNLTTPPFTSLTYSDIDSSGNTVTGTVRLLQQFGDARVLSSPKIMALNNQTALLKVVNETVYFNIELDIRDATANIPERRTFTSEIKTVPVGFVMSVTPQISRSGYVSLNIRPTISRITGFATDPAPRLAGSDFDNLVPEIQVREIESLLQVLDGRTIVLGGLMQNEQISSQDGVPGLSRIPGVGKLFSYNKDDLVKTELVIFLKPTIVKNGSAPEGSAQIADYYEPPADQRTNPVKYR